MANSIETQQKKRNVSIDYLKCIAVFLVINSHMDKMFPLSISKLATGGAIGDALFFFCSGFTLLMKPLPRFDNWYKRRINRIYPTVFAAFVFLVLYSNVNYSIFEVFGVKGAWFVQCILVYYIPLFFIGKYLKKYLWQINIIEMILYIALYYGFGFQHLNCYKPPAFLYFYFFYMLMGATLGVYSSKVPKSIWVNLLGSILCLAAHYAWNYWAFKYFFELHCISGIPLAGLIYFLYGLFNTEWFQNHTGGLYCAIRCFGGLCLEVYLTHLVFISDVMKNIFPLNVIFAVFAIFTVAYFVKVFSNFLRQTFSDNDYEWLKMLRIY